MSRQDWKHLAAKREHAAATLLGSGPSINEITSVQWKRLQQRTDLWAMNNWIYHPDIVPDTYVIETKWYGYDLLKRRLAERRDDYADVDFVFQRDKQIRMKDGTCRFIRDVVWPEANVYEFDIITRDPKRSCFLTDANYKRHPNALTKSYDISLTHVLELIRRVGYSTIILAGIDLYDSRYFWSDGDPKWGEVHHITNKAHEGRNPSEPHNTAMVTGYIVDFSDKLWAAGGRMFVTSVRSSLWPGIPKVQWRTL